MNKLIELKKTSRSFPQGDSVIRALDDLSWTIEDSGKLIAIIGPSGSGKTTLLNLVGALDVADQGEVIIKGVNLSNLSEKELTAYRRQTVCFVFQSYNLIPNLTAIENVMLPMEFVGTKADESRQRALRLLEDVKMSHRKNQKPPKLSGGEQQRVAIARALANDADIVLADEPTGNLDSETSKEIVNLLKNLAHRAGKTVVVVTHDPGTLEFADQQYTLRDGKISN